MKMEIITYSEEYSKKRDYQQALKIKINNKRMFSVSDAGDCPEDATLNRDLSDCYNIEKMLIRAYEAGKNGETLEVIHTEDNGDDD